MYRTTTYKQVVVELSKFFLYSHLKFTTRIKQIGFFDTDLLLIVPISNNSEKLKHGVHEVQGFWCPCQTRSSLSWWNECKTTTSIGQNHGINIHV